MECKELTRNELQTFKDYDGHEKVIRVTDSATGLNAFIAVHNSNIGPALGGCRMVKYATEADAIQDVLRLSRGMTYKNALAGLPLGGGKSVIIGDPYKEKTDAMMQAMGQAVASLNGLYITAEDSGTSEHDMEVMGTQTPFVVGMRGEGERLGGNPSPVTAWGVYNAMKAAARHKFGSETLKGKKVAVQGLGAVGYDLCRLLDRDGAGLIVTDVREAVLEQARKEFRDVQVVALDAIFGVEADIFAPCALGAQLNDKTIPQFKVKVICGAANNQLAEARHHDEVAKRGILYAPDYVVNAGGVISAGYEYFTRSGFNPYQFTLSQEAMMAHVERIGPTVTKVFNIAEARGITPARAADEMAEAIFSEKQGRAKMAEAAG